MVRPPPVNHPPSIATVIFPHIFQAFLQMLHRGDSNPQPLTRACSLPSTRLHMCLCLELIPDPHILYKSECSLIGLGLKSMDFVE